MTTRCKCCRKLHITALSIRVERHEFDDIFFCSNGCYDIWRLSNKVPHNVYVRNPRLMVDQN